MDTICFFTSKNDQKLQKINFACKPIKMRAKSTKIQNLTPYFNFAQMPFMHKNKQKMSKNGHKWQKNPISCSLHALPINARIWSKLKNYGKFWIFDDFARILTGLYAKLNFCHFWSILLVNRQIIPKIRQNYWIRIHRSQKRMIIEDVIVEEFK